MNRIKLNYLQLFLLFSFLIAGCITKQDSKNNDATQFVLKYEANINNGPISGRALLLFSADTLVDPDIPNPFRPFITIGMDFKNWKAGEELIIMQENSTGFMSTINDLNGYYSVRALLDLDTTSCSLYRNGICYSDMSVISVEPGTKQSIGIEVNNLLSGFDFAESEFTKLLEVKSELLSDFYKAETNIEAAVILPESYYKDLNRYYPTVFVFPGWGTTHISASQNDFQQKRYGKGFGEEKIFVIMNQDCRYGYHVFADSDNNGPRATSFIEEFIPAYENEYRVVKNAHARFMVGQSSGAWASLWLICNYPENFGMAWAGSPDPVDFRDFVGHNLYEPDANLFYDKDGKLINSIRSEEFHFTIKDWSAMELATGEGGQFQSFEAVFGRKGMDGKPEQMFDRKTGKILKESLEHWKNYDLNLFIRKNPDDLKIKLRDKINITVADNDDFYLDGSVKLFKETLEEFGFDANIKILPAGGHNAWTDEIRTEMHARMDKLFSGI